MPASGRITVDGQAEVTRAGEDRREFSGSRTLKFGDRVRMLQGTGVIRLPDDRRLELRLGSDLELRAPAGEGAEVVPVLLGGDLLVISGDRPLPVALTGAEVTVRGDVRVSRGVALLVAAYRGSAQLSAMGSTLTVPALRQAALPATGLFPGGVSPLEYLATDTWDQRYLSDAIELSNQLSARSDGFSAQLGPTEGRTAGYFRDLLPLLGAEPGFASPLVNPARLPGETLVGATITLEGKRGTFGERWAAVFAFRDQGAAWGLVALDQAVTAGALVPAVETAISRGPSQFASGPPTGPSGPPISLAPPRSGFPATTSVPVVTSITTTTTRPRPGVTTTSPGAAPVTPTTTTVVGPLNTGAPLIDDAVNSLVTTLTGLLRSLAQL